MIDSYDDEEEFERRQDEKDRAYWNRYVKDRLYLPMAVELFKMSEGAGVYADLVILPYHVRYGWVAAARLLELHVLSEAESAFLTLGTGFRLV